MATRPTRAAKPASQKSPGPAAPAQPTGPTGPTGPMEPAESAGARPVALRVAAAVQAMEAAGMCVAAVFAAISTADGRSYQRASGIALTLIAFGTAAVLALVAAGLAKAKPWSRTPAIMTQLFAGGAAIYLLDGHRYDWAVPALLVAATSLTALFTPRTFRALTRQPSKP